MAVTVDNYSFELVDTAEPSVPIVEACPAVDCDTKLQTEEVNPSNTSVITGCGLVGWVIGGPFLALITAIGGAYAAERNKGPIGDTTRSIGRIAETAAKKAGEERLFCKNKAAIQSIFTGKKCQYKKSQNTDSTSHE